MPFDSSGLHGRVEAVSEGENSRSHRISRPRAIGRDSRGRPSVRDDDEPRAQPE